VKRLPVGVVGLGPIGIEIARAVAAHPRLRLVGVADANPALAGRSLAGLGTGLPRLTIDRDLAALLGRGTAALGVATTSRLAELRPLLRAAVAAGVHAVTTCEEMAAPPADAGLRRLDAAARAAGVSLLGTGVNPGFVMDRLVLQVSAACVRVDAVEVTRVVDAARRRAPLRKKVGEGLTPAEFRRGVAEGRLGHVGLGASVRLVARGLGWALDEVKETLGPVQGADGRCLGVKQEARGVVGGKVRIRHKLAMYVGAEAPHDRIVIAGDPPLDVAIAGGVHGDRATIGTVVEGLVRAPRLPRGLITVAEAY
jgi:4-hydroxy-tetrahydrodipicolinate reductase